MTREEMKARTKAYANRVVKLCAALPNNWIARILGQQLLRSGTSVGANYRPVCRARSDADFINKLRVVEKASRLRDLMLEGSEILAIVVASAKTARTSRGA